MLGHEYSITAVGQHAAHYFSDAYEQTKEYVKDFSNLKEITAKSGMELTSAQPVISAPLFALSFGNEPMSAAQLGDLAPAHNDKISGKGSQGRNA